MVDITTCYGLISTPDLSGDLIQKSLTLHGEWALTEQSLLASLIQPGEVFWDGGAFLGTFGLGVVQLAAKQGCLASRLLAIEPGQDIRSHLQANLEANCPCPFQLATYAISQHKTRLQVNTNVDHSANLGGRAYTVAKTTLFGRGTIKGQPLRRFRKKFGDYTCLKLDIENMELQALQSDYKFIKKTKPKLWIECNEDSASLMVQKTMCGLGYDPLYVAFPAFRAKNFNQHEDLIYPMAYEAALVGVKKTDRQKLEAAAADMPGDILIRNVPDIHALRQALWMTPRWAMQEWPAMTRPELIALLGRYELKQDIGSFLADG